MISRGYKINNPGNLKKGPKLFIGEKPHEQIDKSGNYQLSTDSEFRHFYDMIFGYRAMFKQIYFYLDLGYNTIRKIITRWDPNTADKVNNYVSFVSDSTQIPENFIITKEDKLNLVRLVCAISHYENAQIPDEKIVLKGYDMLDLNKYQ
jgi:hypothetical protein